MDCPIILATLPLRRKLPSTTRAFAASKRAHHVAGTKKKEATVSTLETIFLGGHSSPAIVSFLRVGADNDDCRDHRCARNRARFSSLRQQTPAVFQEDSQRAIAQTKRTASKDGVAATRRTKSEAYKSKNTRSAVRDRVHWRERAPCRSRSKGPDAIDPAPRCWAVFAAADCRTSAGSRLRERIRMISSLSITSAEPAFAVLMHESANTNIAAALMQKSRRSSQAPRRRDTVSACRRHR
ncbi:hypothetical protein HPB51_026698 [Rhipicephalus microplus]|uniref:Uncharacterized protein n=1 Tax=Rhipicephalus microplus TaxID=6941 RepID=A0A9J6D2E0_RHIMP|nr:hypothetical protein HPB51_026698 [Rhipicephalus microplus]